MSVAYSLLRSLSKSAVLRRIRLRSQGDTPRQALNPFWALSSAACKSDSVATGIRPINSPVVGLLTSLTF